MKKTLITLALLALVGHSSSYAFHDMRSHKEIAQKLAKFAHKIDGKEITLSSDFVNDIVQLKAHKTRLCAEKLRHLSKAVSSPKTKAQLDSIAMKLDDVSNDLEKVEITDESITKKLDANHMARCLEIAAWDKHMKSQFLYEVYDQLGIEFAKHMAERKHHMGKMLLKAAKLIRQEAAPKMVDFEEVMFTN